MFNRWSFCSCPSFADFIRSELGYWIKWNLSIKIVAILSIQMSRSFCQEGKTAVWNGKGYCKTCQEFYQGSEMTVGSRKRVSRHWNMSGKINFACGLGDILRHSKILCVIESCICLDYLSNQPCLSMSHRISRLKIRPDQSAYFSLVLERQAVHWVVL